jgi:hypothetical protein
VWLPEAEWTPLKRKVYRIEAALIPDKSDSPAPAGGRIYLDYYVVQFARNQIMKVTAMTTRDPHLKFREMAEDIIKSFDFGPSDGSAASASAPTAAPR